MTLEGATDTQSFRAYVEVVLLPTLQPGDIVMRDNLSPHSRPVPCSDSSSAKARKMEAKKSIQELVELKLDSATDFYGKTALSLLALS